MATPQAHDRFVTWSMFVVAVLLAPPLTNIAAVGHFAPAHEVIGLETLPRDNSMFAFEIEDRGPVAGASSGPVGRRGLSGFIRENDSMSDPDNHANHEGMSRWGSNDLDHVATSAGYGPDGSNFGRSPWEFALRACGKRGIDYEIKNSTQAAGSIRLPSRDFSRGFVRAISRRKVPLPTQFPHDPGNGTSSDGEFEGGHHAIAIDRSGTVVRSIRQTNTYGKGPGFDAHPQCRAFGRDGEIMLDVKSPIDPEPGWTQMVASDVNMFGRIVGEGRTGNVSLAEFPRLVPETASIALIVSANACGLVRSIRNRFGRSIRNEIANESSTRSSRLDSREIDESRAALSSHQFFMIGNPT